MKNAWLIICIITVAVSTAAGQVNILPKTGEGRYDRSKKTVFWPNTMFTHPSFFLSEGAIDVRPMRKWWRDPMPPVASAAHPAFHSQEVESLLLEPNLATNSKSPLWSLTLEFEPFLPAFQPIQPETCLVKKQLLDYLDTSSKNSPLFKLEKGYDALFSDQ